MFGTDQMFWPEAIGTAIDNIESAPFLTKAQSVTSFTTTRPDSYASMIRNCNGPIFTTEALIVGLEFSTSHFPLSIVIVGGMDRAMQFPRLSI